MTGTDMTTGLKKDSRGSDGMSGRLFWQAVRRHPVLFLGVLLLTAGAGVALWRWLPLPRYTATVVFQVNSQAPAVLAPPAEGRVDFSSYRQTQSALIHRRQVLANALSQSETRDLAFVRSQQDPVTALDQQLVIDFRVGTEFMRVTLEGDNPAEQRAILQGLTRAYLAEVDERENGQRRTRLARLEEVRREHQGRLDTFQKGIDAIAIRLGSKDGATLALMDQLTREELGQASRELTEIEAQLQLATPEKDVKPGGPAPDPKEKPKAKTPTVSAALVDDQLRREGAVVIQEAEVARAKEHLVEVEKLFNPGAVNATLTKARDQVKAAEDRLTRIRADLRPRIEAALRDQMALDEEKRREQLALEDQKQTALNNDAVTRLKRRQQAISGRIEEIKTKIGENNRFRIDLENLKSQIAHTDRLSANLAEEIDRLRMELNAPSRVTLSEEPFIVAGIQGNRRLKMTLLGLVGVFVLGYGALVFWEYRTRRVTHADDASAGLGLRLLGTVPPAGARVRAYRNGVDPQRAFAEAIDTTRTMLLYGNPSDRRVRTVLVTSAVDGEGKTSLAGHLAISLTRAGYTTLLVDGDVRAPSAHNLFGLPASPGLCEVLRGQVDASAVIHPTPVPGLSVLPAGGWDLATRQALTGDRWPALKRELEVGYDFVVVDSGPVLLVSDSLLLARDADGVLLSVLLDVSRVASVAETRNRLQSIGANVLGVVVNGVVTPTYRAAQNRAVPSVVGAAIPAA
jgi:polysaccharide biosynthesis transport protein